MKSLTSHRMTGLIILTLVLLGCILMSVSSNVKTLASSVSGTPDIHPGAKTISFTSPKGTVEFTG